METLADTLKRLRREAGIASSRRLAERSGISEAVIRNIESGRKETLSREEIVAFCQATGASPYEFLPELDPAADGYEAKIRRRLRRQLLTALSVLDEEER